MALNEAALRKLGKEEIIKLTLEYQSKSDLTLSSINDIKTDLSELRKSNEKLVSDVVITKQENTKLCDKIKFLEGHCWANKQYSRRECLEMFQMFQNLLLIMIWRRKLSEFIRKKWY